MELRKEKGLMTEGPIARHMILFAMPLVAGNLFKQMYNMVDSIVVGLFIGGTALAAVGSSGPVINLLVGLFIGLTNGASVVISQHFGAGRLKEVKDTIHTAIFFCIIFGLLLSVAGIFLVDYILVWMDTPEEVFHQASVYLKVFFSGVFFMGLYNMGASVLRGMGNSRDPLIYLAIVCVVNIVLDIIFVVAFGMDVEGVAIATVLAQAIAAGMVLRKMMNFPKEYRVSLKEIKCHAEQLKPILQIGIPSGIQTSIVSFSNVIVQGAINGFGADAMAGWSAYSKLDMILLMPFHSLGVAMTTFAGQNIGANRLDRVSGAVKITAIINCSWAAVTGLILYVLAGPALSIFCEEQAVLDYGVYMLRGMVPFYFLLGLNQVFAGAINGAGDTMATMVVSVSTMCVMRVLILKILGQFVTTFDVVFAAYVWTWVACAGLQGLYYFSGRWKKKIKTIHGEHA